MCTHGFAFRQFKLSAAKRGEPSADGFRQIFLLLCHLGVNLNTASGKRPTCIGIL
jgi:hypothetical protein